MPTSKLLPGAKVRVLELGGTISKIVYTLPDPKPDRNQNVTLHGPKGVSPLKADIRRLMPVATYGQAVASHKNGRWRAICSLCGHMMDLTAPDGTLPETVRCPEHGELPIFYLGDKPMTTATKSDKPKAKPKPAKEKLIPTQVDLSKLAKLPKCALYTKNNVAFNQPHLTVKAHVLIYNSDKPRKLCFNTYDGTLGKRGGSLPIEEFLHDKTIKGKKKPWFPLDTTVEKLIAKLEKQGYEHIKE